MSTTRSDQGPATPASGSPVRGRQVRPLSSARLRRVGLIAVPAVAGLLLAACGGSSGGSSALSGGSSPSSGSGGGASSTPSAAASSPDTSATTPTTATGGGLGCLSGHWTSQDMVIKEAGSPTSHGGSGVGLTISGSGAMTMDASNMSWITINSGAASGKMRYRGTDTGQLFVKGNKLSGKQGQNNLILQGNVAGHKINMPLKDYTGGANTLSWTKYSCSGSTLRMLASHEVVWTFTRS
jgi:hypothetical protein